MIYFITGSSGVGKSTLVKSLKDKLLADFKVHDFDEVGVPHGADLSWRLATTRKWIETAKENSLNNISTIIVGLTHPDEVNEIAVRESVKISYVMLEVDDDELKKRLMAFRFSTPERIENLMKYEKVTPEEFFENNKRHVQKIKEEALGYDAIFIDTTHKSPEDVAGEVLQRILN
jgi:putative ribosome biogenesis GTPase RsgA